MLVRLPILEEWEAQRVALHDELYREGVGLPYSRDEVQKRSAALSALSERMLASASNDAERLFSVESLAEAREVPFDERLRDAQDRWLVAPHLKAGAESLTWRNWRRFEREHDSPEALRTAFDYFVERSLEFIPDIQARYDAQRGDFAQFGLTPAETFAAREGTTTAALRRQLAAVGASCAAPLRSALDRLSLRVFGRPAGYAEFRALYLNRMYDPLAPAVAAVDGLEFARESFASLGFDLSRFSLDLEERPEKYPGAFCYPIRIPEDVRVSVRIASSHHLLDMLFHEFGHAVHFAGIRADLPVIDRYWIHSGVHETYSTFFELLLGEPGLLRRAGFDDPTIADLVEFDRFKALLTGTWMVASGLVALEAWQERLTWPEIERRYADHLREFTGIQFPAGFARLSPFVASASVYPVGYVMAMVRCAHWRRSLRREFGDEWWGDRQAGEAVREWIRPGGSVRFPDEWLDPGPMLEWYAG